MFGASVVTDGFGIFRVHGACPLGIPVQFPAGIPHFVIDISCMGDMFCDVSGMGCNSGSDNALFYIIDIRKRQMFRRGYIT